MITVHYGSEFGYTAVGQSSAPLLALRVTAPASTGLSVDIDAHLDSGAERSLFDGALASMLGLELLAGKAIRFAATAGPAFEARVHRAWLWNESVGGFELELALTTQHIRRNLLGRDFFMGVEQDHRAASRSSGAATGATISPRICSLPCRQPRT